MSKNPKKDLINGPVNIVRLVGEINGVKKTVYLFMDFHKDVESQTQCGDPNSSDVNKYFLDTFKREQTDMVYDFFLETWPTELSEKVIHGDNEKLWFRDNYIEEVVKLFKTYFDYDRRENRVIISQHLRNVRLHYLDIRDYNFDLRSTMRKIMKLVSHCLCKIYIDVSQINRLLDYLKEILGYVKFMVSILEESLSLSKNGIKKKPEHTESIILRKKTQLNDPDTPLIVNEDTRVKRKSRNRKADSKPSSKSTKRSKRSKSSKSSKSAQNPKKKVSREQMLNKIEGASDDDRLRVLFDITDKREYEKIMKYFVEKISNKYHHDNVKTVLIQELMEIVDLANQLDEYISSTIFDIKKYRRELDTSEGVLSYDPGSIPVYQYETSSRNLLNIIKRIFDNVDHIDNHTSILFVYLTDVYLLRRLLDKDYVTNAVVYTGATHSCNYVSKLVKHFDFKITHASYSKFHDMKKLNHEIKNTSWTALSDLLWPKTFLQCADISRFPKHFM